MNYHITRPTGAGKDGDAISVDLDLEDIAATIDQIADTGVSRSAILWALQAGGSELWNVLDGEAEPSPDLAEQLGILPLMGALPPPPPGGDMPVSVTIGRSARDNDATTVRELTVAQLFDLLTDHKEGPKDGPCIIPARFRNGVRRKEDADEIGVLMLDIDDGHTIEEAEAAIRRLNWTAAIYTTNSHTPERHKFRIALPLARPWRASDYPDQNSANDAWKARVEAAAGALGLKHDAACTDSSRLFYLPRHPPGVVPCSRVVVGTFCDLHALAAAPAVSRQKAPAPVARDHQAAPAEYIDPETGEIFDLRGWIAGHGARFKIADALRHRSPNVMRGKVADRVKHHIVCPCADEHTKISADFATFVINAGESNAPGKGFIVHCMHNACTGRDRQAFVAQMLADGSLTPADLTDPAFLLPELDAVEAAVDELNGRHAVVMVKGKALVLTDKDEYGRETFALARVHDVKPWFENQIVGTSKGGATTTKLDVWLKSPRRRQFGGLEFAPDGAPEGIYNMWVGFAVEPNPHASCEKFLEHLRVNVAQGSEAHFNYIVGWLAQIVQQPWLKPGVALVLRGKKGVGKSKVGEYFGAIFRPVNNVVLAQPEQLTGKHNTHLQQALLIQVEEGFWAGDKKAEGVLKHMVTSARRLVEPKNVDIYEVRDCARLLITSNSDWVVPTTQEERRWAVFDVGDKHQQNHAYFAAIDAELKAGGASALLDYLLRFDLSTVNVWTAPSTEALRDQKLASLGSDAAFIRECLASGSIGGSLEWPETIEKGYLHGVFVKYARDIHNDRHPAKNADFGRTLHKIIPGVRKQRPRVEGGTRRQAYVLPPLEECRAAFNKWLGQSVDWDADD